MRIVFHILHNGNWFGPESEPDDWPMAALPTVGDEMELEFIFPEFQAENWEDQGIRPFGLVKNRIFYINKICVVIIA